MTREVLKRRYCGKVSEGGDAYHRARADRRYRHTEMRLSAGLRRQGCPLAVIALGTGAVVGSEPLISAAWRCLDFRKPDNSNVLAFKVGDTSGSSSAPVTKVKVILYIVKDDNRILC